MYLSQNDTIMYLLTNDVYTNSIYSTYSAIKKRVQATGTYSIQKRKKSNSDSEVLNITSVRNI
jgi:hypothetical protein